MTVSNLYFVQSMAEEEEDPGFDEANYGS